MVLSKVLGCFIWHKVDITNKNRSNFLFVQQTANRGDNRNGPRDLGTVGRRPGDRGASPTGGGGDRRRVRQESAGDEPSSTPGPITSLDTDFHYVDISADSGWDTDLEAEGKWRQW